MDLPMVLIAGAKIDTGVVGRTGAPGKSGEKRLIWQISMNKTQVVGHRPRGRDYSQWFDRAGA